MFVTLFISHCVSFLSPCWRFSQDQKPSVCRYPFLGMVFSSCITRLASLLKAASPQELRGCPNDSCKIRFLCSFLSLTSCSKFMNLLTGKDFVTKAVKDSTRQLEYCFATSRITGRWTDQI